jgi:tight adherence protein B
VTFVAAIAVVAGVYSIATDLFLRDRSRVSRRVDDEFRTRQRERAKKSLLFKNLAQVAAEASAEDRAEAGLRQRFEAMVEQSGLDLTPGRLLGIMAGAGLTLGAFGGVVRQSPIVAALGVLVGAVAPLMYVQRKRKARLDKLLSQLPDAFDLMSRVVRAGQTMSQALQAVADEFQPPIAAEFSYCFEQQNLGLPPEVAMRDLARRTGLLETKIFVLALLVQQQTGGNLAELLDKLAAIIRDRFRIRGVMKTLTAEGRMQAVVLLGLPPALFLMMLVLNHDYARVLLDHPNLIVGTLVCEGIGAVWIRSIVNFDF